MPPDLQRKILVAVTVLLVGWWLWRKIRRTIRRRLKPKVHPSLQKYQPDPDVAAMRRAEAAKVIATSSTGDIAGYRIVRQIEAVYVDGFRRPEEAVEGLKAASAMKGANAVTNVRHAPSREGRYFASGDAVLVQPVADSAAGG